MIAARAVSSKLDKGRVGFRKAQPNLPFITPMRQAKAAGAGFHKGQPKLRLDFS